MTDYNNTPTATPSADEISECVLAVENLIGDHSREDTLCILLTVTVNAIHVVEIKDERKRVQEEYINALRFLSAVEEQFQPEDVGAPPDWVQQCAGKMLRHVIRAYGGSAK